MKKLKLATVFRLVLVIIFLTGCTGKTTPQPVLTEPVVPTLQATPEKPTAQPTVSPTAPPSPAVKLLSEAGAPSPRVILPQGGGWAASDGSVEVRFSQPMDAGSTTSVFHLSDASGKDVVGKVEWPSPDRLLFHPADPLQPGATYHALIDEGALSQDGTPLQEAARLDFQVSGAIQVGQVFPADGTQGVSNDSVITVLFNRPVVPLRVAEEQTNLINPLVIDPPVEGYGEWVNTSVFVYHPSGKLLSSTMYTVTIPAGLEDQTGSGSAPLPEEVRWTFTTSQPSVKDLAIYSESFQDEKTYLAPGQYFASAPLLPTLKMGFLQAMDHAATEAAISLIAESSGAAASIQFSWSEDSQQVDVQPVERLALGTTYRLTLAASGRAQDGGELATDYLWTIRTVEPPAVRAITPADGASAAEPWEFGIEFVSPMKIDTIASRVVFDPPLDETAGASNWYYDPYQYRISFYGLSYSTNYSVHILPGMEDIYGNATQGERTIRFRTRAMDSQAWFAVPSSGLWRMSSLPEFYLHLVNQKEVQVGLYRLSPDTVARFDRQNNPEMAFQYVPPASDLQWKQTITPELKPDRPNLVKVQINPPEGRLPSGFYLLTVDGPGLVHQSQPFQDVRVMVVSDANLTLKVSQNDALVWLTSLSEGKPLANVPVKIYEGVDYQPVGQGRTDSNGLLKIEIPRKNNGQLYAVAGESGNPDFAYTSDFWGSGVWPGQFGISEGFYRTPQPKVAYLYTERPIYRPGQEVFFKGVVRKDDDLTYSLPEDQAVTVVISSYEDEIYRATLPVSDYGTVDGSFMLDQDASLGWYFLQLYSEDGENNYGSVGFTVADYRRPEFQVKVETASADVLAGDRFSANVRAEYYSGGGVANANVTWTLTSQAFHFTPPGDFSRYSFYDLDRDTVDYSAGVREPVDNLLAEGTGQTDENGLLTLTVPADLKVDASQRLILEVTVSDLAGAVVSGRAEVVAHRSKVYPGLRFDQYVGLAGEQQTVELAALDWLGSPLAGQSVTVEIVERRWNSVQEQNANGQVQWTSSVEEVPVETFEGIKLDSGGKGEIQFTPPRGGVYRARVMAQDLTGRRGAASDYLWVAGDSYIPWRQSSDRSFQLIADRSSYQPGDTARLMIASPFQGKSYALITVERGRIRKEEVVQLESNSTIYDLLITPDMAPNAYVSVLVVKGIDETNPYPDFRVGMTELRVAANHQELKVEISTDRETAGPGEQITYTVITKDWMGQPVSAEVSLGLSDLSTLSLATPNSQPILDGFYNLRSLSVRTGVALINSVEAYNAMLSEDTGEQGRGGGSGGGNKGEGEMGVMSVRQDFPDTAYWKANLRTDSSGQVSVTITLPDNLTTWRMDARAVTPDTLVGQTSFDLVSTKPLLVRPQTPRFFVAGDQATVGAAVHNNSDQDLEVRVELAVENLELQNDPVQTVPIKAGQQSYVTWQVSVPQDAQTVQMTFSAQGGPYQDASHPTIGNAGLEGLPVYRYEAPETVSTSGQMPEGGTRAEAIVLPETWNVTQGELSVSVSPSLSASLTDGLDYLKSYPYECTEQVISRFLPNVAISRVLKEAGVTDPELQTGLDEQVNLALQRLASWQNLDGGWAYWKGGKSDSLVTAYAVLGLLEAQGSGYDVPGKSLLDALAYLNVQGLNSTENNWQSLDSLRNREAFTLYVLARAGMPRSDRMGNLYENRANLQLYARAYLMQALWRTDPDDPRLETLMSDLTSAAVLSASGAHWNEASTDRWNWNTDTRTTAILLDALTQTNPHSPITANTVRWLMAHRVQGRWQGTQETAWTLLALADWMQASGELQASYAYAVGLNNETVGEGEVSKDNLREVWTDRIEVRDLLKDEANHLVFARTEGSGTLYYTADLRVWLPVVDIQPLDRGIVISREYFREDAPDQSVTDASVGDLLRVRLTIVSPAGLHYVVIRDPLPAGLEAVDTNLLNSPQAEFPNSYSWADWNRQGWGWWYFTHAELRDEALVLSTDYLPAGTYVYTYLVRASTRGVFNVIPPTAQEFYFPDVYGRGAGSQFEVR